MATEHQYEFFKAVYDEEGQRYGALLERTKLYQGIITLYVGAITLKAEDIVKFATQFHVPVVLFLGTGGLLLIGLALTVLASRIREYEGISDLEELIENFGSTPSTDADFWDERLVDLAVATARNTAQNDNVAQLLQVTAWIIFAAVLLQVLAVSIAMLKPLS